MGILNKIGEAASSASRNVNEKTKNEYNEYQTNESNY